jgi:hypothetical protein
MNGWSREDGIAMERRHILEGEQLLAKQQALMEKLIAEGHHGLVETASELLGILRESVELSRARLRELEHRRGERQKSN